VVMVVDVIIIIIVIINGAVVVTVSGVAFTTASLSTCQARG
jgi:hypothetical protein